MNGHTAVGAVFLGLASALNPMPALADELMDRPEAGVCHVPVGTNSCLCSLSPIGAALTFGEAADMVEVFYRGTLDASYVALLVSLLKQCSGGPPSAPVPPQMLRSMNVLAPSSK